MVTILRPSSSSPSLTTHPPPLPILPGDTRGGDLLSQEGEKETLQRESIYSVEDELMPHAEYVLDKIAAKQCRNMMYCLRVDAVKEYYDKYLNQRIKDAVACKKLLRQTQYAKVKPDWISEAAWCAICAYWCSPDYLKKRRLAQESRNQADFAQNRGGSRPYAQTKQYLGKTYGPQAATDMNTFCSMKSGVKNCDSNGNSG